MRQVDAAAHSKAAQLGVTNVVYIGVPGDTGSRDRRGCGRTSGSAQ
jgi:hypothetical protein